TVDGGESWEIQNSTVSGEIRDIFFLDKFTGWALAWSIFNPSGTLILHTTDGGIQWAVDPFPTENAFLSAVYFQNPLHGFAGGPPNVFVRTTDGGREWNPVTIDSGATGFPPLDIVFYNDQLGFAGGGHIDIAGVVWRTTNGGANWTAEVIGPEPLQDMLIFDALNVIGMGGDFEYGTSMVRTTDGGETWEYHTLQIFGIAWAVDFRTPREGWAAMGYTNQFIRTTDAGQTWEIIPTPNGEAIYDLVFTDSLHGYAVGDNGAILKFLPEPMGLSGHDAAPLPTAARLLANYPNPFNAATRIAFTLPYPARVRLTVYDALGRTVTTLLNRRMPAGMHVIPFTGERLPSGIYYYTLELHSPEADRPFLRQTRRMILVR
ncbi:MAG: T9SS C-terminal target domain-containing protein, partial [Calditrichaeota bacterium]